MQAFAFRIRAFSSRPDTTILLAHLSESICCLSDLLPLLNHYGLLVFFFLRAFSPLATKSFDEPSRSFPFSRDRAVNQPILSAGSRKAGTKDLRIWQSFSYVLYHLGLSACRVYSATSFNGLVNHPDDTCDEPADSSYRREGESGYEEPPFRILPTPSSLCYSSSPNCSIHAPTLMVSSRCFLYPCVRNSQIVDTK